MKKALTKGSKGSKVAAKVVKTAKVAAKATAKATATVKKVEKPAAVVKTVPGKEAGKESPKKYVAPGRKYHTRSTHGKFQTRSTGSRRVKNNWGHFEGTIGSQIDVMISKGNFTKNQMMAYAGTKMSKINSHINHLRKEKGFPVKIVSGIVSFG